jgi:hypothetical protein
MNSGIRTIYFALCLIPWVLLPFCYGVSENPLETLLGGFGGLLFVGLIVEALSPSLAVLGFFVTVAAPRGSRAGLLLAAVMAGIPGLWILNGIAG